MDIEQKDIDRLLICREAIDKHRAFKLARAKALSTAKTVAEVKTLIESKIAVATTIPVDSSVKPPEEIKEILEEERTKSTLAMYEFLRQQGFESYAAFGKFNFDMCLEEYKRCHPMRGACDLCGEEEIKDQPCVKAFGLSSCGFKGTKEITDDLYLLSMKSDKEGTFEYSKDGIYVYSRHKGGCPDGHGFYGLVEDRKEFRFDVFWRV
jgi:hypothetical protein